MLANGQRYAAMVFCVALLVGCRNSQPAMVPEKSAESLVEPPAGGRYDKPAFPPEAFDPKDDLYRLGAAPRVMAPTSGIGSRSNGGMGPYKY